MKTLHVILKVNKLHVDAFKTATLTNLQATRQENGCARFEVLQDMGDPTRFIIIEQYHDEKAMNEHFASEHFQEWIKATASLIVDSEGGHFTLVESE